MKQKANNYNAKRLEANLAALMLRNATQWSSGDVVNAKLQRYFALMAQAAEDLWWLFTLAEMCLLIEACGRDIPAQAIPDVLWQDVLYNVQEEGRAKVWGVSADSFLAKVDAMTPVEWFALAELSVQFFTAEDAGLREVLAEADFQTLEDSGRTCQQ